MPLPFRPLPVHLHHVRLRHLALATLAMTSALSACSGRPSAQEALDELHISDSPEVVVATAVERLDPTFVLGPDLVSDYLRVKYALRGFSWADAQCAVDRTRELVTPAVLDALELGRVDDLGYDHPDLDAATRTCASAESSARLNLPLDRTTTTLEGAPRPTAAPDIDGATVSRMSRGFYALTTKDLGITSTERDCMYDAVFGKRSDADMVKLILGVIPTSVDATAPKVVACLKDDRFDVITPVAAKELLARQKAVRQEHDRVQSLLDASVAAASTTTTVVGGG